MNHLIGLISSVDKLVSGASRRAIRHCGIALFAVTPLACLAESLESVTSSPSTLYVNCAAGSHGDGSARHPYWRITDALEGARKLRRENPRRITISVAAGICSGNFEPQPIRQTTRPPELLPLVLNVPNLTLHGAGVLEYAGEFPVRARAGTATTLTVDTVHNGDYPTTMIYVGPTTDGGRADGAVIEGFVVANAQNTWFGIDIARTQRITVRDNVVTDAFLGDINGSDCSGLILGNVVHGGSPGIFFSAGTPTNPSILYIGGNSATDNTEGVGFSGDASVTDRLDMGANPLEVLPYPIAAAQMVNRIEVEVEGNNVSNNYYGLRFLILGGARYPYAQTGYISADIRENRFVDNYGYPFAVDEGFVFRGTSSYWTDPSPDPTDFPEGFLASLALPFITRGPFDGPYSGTVNAHFEGNLWSNPHTTPTAPAILTYSNLDVYDPATGLPDPSLVQLYAYMSNSRLNFVDEDGLLNQPGIIRDDLRLFDPVDGDRLNNQTRIRY